MTELLIQYINWGVDLAPTWGILMVFILMTIESSFIPLPSEVVLIPAGFMIFRNEFTFHSPVADASAVLFAATAGSLAGAFINYYLASKLGRPFLYSYGKYFFLSPKSLNRAEEIFKKHASVTTFICRLLPAIRHLISIPAGFAQMPLKPFSVWTSAGAFLWSGILIFVGYYMGTLAKDMEYSALVYKGKDMIHSHFHWVVIFSVIVIGLYMLVHKKIMHSEAQN